MPRKRDVADYYLQTLAQAVARKYPEITDYACNVYADRIAQLDLIIGILKAEGVSKSEIEEIQTVREYYKKLGTALWFMQAGELTNLGAKLGSKIVESEWSPSK